MDKLLKEIDIIIQEIPSFDSEKSFKNYTFNLHDDFKLEDIRDVKIEGIKGYKLKIESERSYFHSNIQLKTVINNLSNMEIRFYNVKEMILTITVEIEDKEQIIFISDNNGKVYKFIIKATITVISGIIKRIQFGLNNFGNVLTSRGCEPIDVETIERISNKITLQVDMKDYEIEFKKSEIIIMTNGDKYVRIFDKTLDEGIPITEETITLTYTLDGQNESIYTHYNNDDRYYNHIKNDLIPKLNGEKRIYGTGESNKFSVRGLTSMCKDSKIYSFIFPVTYTIEPLMRRF